MTQDYNLNINVAGGLQNAMDANAAFVAGEGSGGVAAASLPLLMAQKQAVENIRRDFAARVPPLQSLFKGMGIEVSFKSLLKQSQIFTSTIGALFQMFGAMIDMVLAPFTKYLVVLIEKFAEWIPKIGRAAEWAEKFIFGPIITAISNVRSFIRNPGEVLGPAFKNMGLPDWLNPWSGGDGDGGGGDSSIGVFLDNAIMSAFGGTALLAAVSQKFRNLLKDAIVLANPKANLEFAREGRSMEGLIRRFFREAGLIPQEGATVLDDAAAGIRTTKLSQAGDWVDEGAETVEETRGVIRTIRDRVVKGWNIIDETFRSRIRALRGLVNINFSSLWPGVKPHLDSLIDGIRLAFSTSTNRSIVGIILTGIAAIAIGVKGILGGGAEDVARQLGVRVPASPIARATSTLLTKYGSDVDPGVLAERGMTPVADMPSGRVPFYSDAPLNVSGWRRFTNPITERIPDWIKDNVPFTGKNNQLAPGEARFSAARTSRLRGPLTAVAVAASLYQGYDQQKRDRETEIYQGLRGFRHSDPEAPWYEQAGGEVQGLVGFNNIGWSQQTQFDLMAQTFIGTLIGVLTAPAGFWAGMLGQGFQESAMAENNRLTGQPWQTGTVAQPLNMLTDWLGWTGGGGGSTTNVTVNFPGGRQETQTFDDEINSYQASYQGGFVKVEVEKNATESLNATAPTEWDNSYLIG